MKPVRNILPQAEKMTDLTGLDYVIIVLVMISPISGVFIFDFLKKKDRRKNWIRVGQHGAIDYYQHRCDPKRRRYEVAVSFITGHNMLWLRGDTDVLETDQGLLNVVPQAKN